MVQRTVLKVDISCQKSKKQLLKAVSGLEGIDKVEIDAAKGTLTVTGDADPYKVIVKTRQTNKNVEVVTIGPPPAPQKPDGGGGGGQKKPDEKKPAQDQKKPDVKPQEVIYLPHSCQICERMAFGMGHRNEPNVSCSIM